MIIVTNTQTKLIESQAKIKKMYMCEKKHFNFYLSHLLYFDIIAVHKKKKLIHRSEKIEIL